MAWALKGLVLRGGRAGSAVGGPIRAVSSSESEDSDECAAEMVEEKDDVELLLERGGAQRREGCRY